jgi:DNA-binding PadR family transcriptional regulator
VLLGLLREEELTGYEMKKLIDIRMSFFWNESYGQIYPELNSLLKDGFIEEVKCENRDSKREKVKYRITKRGEEEFNNWMVAENEKDTIRSEFLLKMFLSTNQNKEEMSHHLGAFLLQMKSQLDLFLLFDQQVRAVYDLHQNHQQTLDVLELGIRQSQLYLDWGEKKLKVLKDESKDEQVLKGDTIDEKTKN